MVPERVRDALLPALRTDALDAADADGVGPLQHPVDEPPELVGGQAGLVVAVRVVLLHERTEMTRLQVVRSPLDDVRRLDVRLGGAHLKLQGNTLLKLLSAVAQTAYTVISSSSLQERQTHAYLGGDYTPIDITCQTFFYIVFIVPTQRYI